MSAIKTYPTHNVTFEAKTIDDQGRTKLGQPIDVAAVWARRNGKKGGLLSWNMSPRNLGEGQYRLQANTYNNQATQSDMPKTHRISFAEKRDDLSNGSQLGRPVNVAKVEDNGVINWAIEPGRLNEGVFFVLENERQNQHGKDKGDALDQITAQGQQRQSALAR